MVGWQVHAILGLGVFALGAVVGSFLNVCIYRIPWQKSVIWPASHCPKCVRPIAPQDNVPILSWLALRGECRECGASIAARYPLIELLVALLFVGVYLADVAANPDFSARIAWAQVPYWLPPRVLYHLVLVGLLVVATFIDYDLMTIPDRVTVTGMLIGIGFGTLVPAVRPDPAHAATMAEGFKVGLIGLLVGGGLTQTVRLTGSLALRREAMGFGDVTLMAMIGSFLGWQASVLTFFLAPFFGLGHAAAKTIVYLGKRLSGRPSSSADREIPYGPYLSMAAVALLLSWSWLWDNWAKERFEILSILFTT